MNPGFKKFFIKISRLKGDVASLIGLRLSFVISFFVSLLVLTILNLTFVYDKGQIMPKTADYSNASMILNLKVFNKFLNYYDFSNNDDSKQSVIVEDFDNPDDFYAYDTSPKTIVDIVNEHFNRDILKYVFIKDRDRNEIIFKDLPDGYIIENDPKNKNESRVKDLENNIFLRSTRIEHSIVKDIKDRIETRNYYIYFGFGPNYEMADDLNNLMKSYSIIFVVLALLLTFSVTYFVSMLILSPLERLRAVASKFAEGDLSDRVESTYFTEINDLITSYNTMADVLQKLYSSLEAEVSARTKELKSAYSELQSTQAMMVHSEKMKSLGELVAGIMHEINNPINFIYGNMTHLDNYSKDLISIIDEYSDLDKDLSDDLKKKYKSLKEDLDYDFIKSDIPDLIKSCKEGAERAKNIIQDLKSFSRFEESAISNINIEKEVDTCLTILYNKYKNRITIHKEFPENMPTIEAYGGQLNQVFMNILDNAIGAIPEQGDIWIRALFTNNNVRVEIEDNGSGMSEETKQKVFNPFFTTKPVGQGTGLGMSITYKVIKNHNGDIEIESKEGIGTKFIITLPLNIDRELMIKDKKEEV